MNKYKTDKQDYLKRTLPELPPWWVVSFSTSTGKNGVNVRTVVAIYAPLWQCMHRCGNVCTVCYNACFFLCPGSALFPVWQSARNVALPRRTCCNPCRGLPAGTLSQPWERWKSYSISTRKRVAMHVSACVAERALRSFQTHMCDATCNTCRSDHNNKYIRPHKQEARMNERQWRDKRTKSDSSQRFLKLA